MATKLQFYQSVSEQAAKDVTAKHGNWTNFLDTAARLYKYAFPDQLLIHAQRPDATACATAEMWTDTFGRWNKRGSKGIALIDDSGSFPKLKYVFDISDTYPLSKNSRLVYLWEMRQEHREPVLDYLTGVYDDVGETLADSFRNIARQLAREYYEDNAREIRYRAEDSFLEDFDDTSLSVAFENALTNSIAYTLLSRCGFDAGEYFEDDDFRHIFDFNTPDMVYALGTATNELSAQVLRDIELVIKKYERQHAAERSAENEQSNNIHTSRGLSFAGHQAERTASGTDRTAGQIRENEESISQRPQDDDVQRNAAERDAVPAPSRSRGSSENEVRTSDESVDGKEHAARQGDRPDGLDGGDERIESASGGNGTERADLRVLGTQEKGADAESVPFSLEEQASRLAEALSTSSITVDEVDSILRDGGNDDKSVLRIAAHFSKGLSQNENTAFLRREYLTGRWGHNEEPGGKGYQFGVQKTAVWFDETGINIGRGKSAIYASDHAHLTWEQAAERVKALYDAGQYVSHDVLDEALYNESAERADDIIEVYQNIRRGLSDIQYELKKAMPKEQQEALKDDWKIRRYLINGLSEFSDRASEVESNENEVTPDEVMALYNESLRISEPIPPEWGFDKGHPETVTQITALLCDKGELRENDINQDIGYNELSEFALIVNRLRKDVAALENEPDAPIRFWRDPYRLLSNLEKAGLPTHGFPVTDYQPMHFMRFITDDEIDRYLSRGGHFSEGKLRMLSHFLNDHTPQERIKCLKDEYGHGGGTWVGGGWYNAEPSKGINLKRPGCEDINLNWNQAVKRTQELVQSGRFASQKDLASIYVYERLILARQIKNFYYGLSLEEYEPPFPKDLDFHHPKEAEWTALNDFLGDTERIDGVLAQMQYIFANTPEEDRYYHLRSAGFHCLSSFRDGTYTLFPGIENLPNLQRMASRRVMDGADGSTAPENGTRPQFAAKPIHPEIKRQQNEPLFSKPSNPSNQLSLFDTENFPVLPSAEEQQVRIERKNALTAEENAPAVSFSITQEEIDALLLTISDEEKALLSAQLSDNPRSKEAVHLVREIYCGIEETLPRMNGENGYLWIIGDNTGVKIVGASPLRNPKDEIEPAETVNLPWATVIKRISELAVDGQLIVAKPEQQEPPVFTEPDIRRSVDFERMIADGEIAITPIQDALLSSTGGQSAPELDFDTIAEEIYKQVLDNNEFHEVLSNATSRGALRRSLNTALDSVIADYESEPRMHEYLTKGDVADNLFDFIYRKAWDERETKDVQQTQAPKPTAERLLSQDGTDYYLFHHPGSIETPANLSIDTLSLITERADKYIICADACYLSEENMAQYGIAFRKMPRDFGLLPESVRGRIATIRPDIAKADFIGATVTEETEQQNKRDILIAQAAQDTPKPLMITPPPVFFVDWDNAQFDIDLNLYNDRDIIGYNKEGVEYALGRSGNFTYTTTTTQVTTWGQVFGNDSIPHDIRQQIDAYRKGELSDEQVRENYINVLEAFKNYRAADLKKTHAELVDVLDSGIFSASEKIALSAMLENNVTNDVLAEMLSSEYKRSAQTMILTSGEEADFKATSQGVEIIVPEKLHNVSTWTSIAPIVRSLAQKWATEPENERPVIEPESADTHGVEQVDEELPTGRRHAVSGDDPRNARFLPIQQEISTQSQNTSIDTAEDIRNDTPQETVKLRPSAIVEQILSPGAEVNQIYATYDAIKNGYAKHEIISLQTHKERHTADGVNALILRDLLANADDLRFSSVGAFYEHERYGVKYPHFVVYDWNLARQKIAEAGYSIEIDGKIERPVDRPSIIPSGVNFRITDDHLGEGGAKTKFRNNINAINTLKDIELEKRTATPEEQEILSRYIGWGGLPQAFDPDNKQWTNEYLELNTVLTPEEFESARTSTLNAHYTSPMVIRAIYEAVERMGFKSGNILEPSCGVGNFFGLLPECMNQSKLYGVEIDSVTARIAKQLYPKANIKEMGYEKTDMPDAFFDLAIGNVPFGNYQVVDKRYDKHKFAIHDYFFAKTLDQVRPGGVIAFITSKFTLDKQNPDIRKYIAQRAELLGAVRLPNNAFLKNAGTETTMDILFIQKRDRPMDIEPDWVHLGLTEDNLPVNRYFLDNPEMLLGKMALDEHMNNKYGRNDVTCCLPTEDADLVEQLKTALLNIQGQYTVGELDDIEGIDNHAIPADPNVKNFSYTTVGDTVYFRENSLMYPVELPATTLDRIKGMIALRDCVHELIALQLDNFGEDAIKAKQAELNTLYDKFSAEYGLINSQGNSRAFNADNAYYLLSSLEILNEDNEFERKADMFTKRVRP